MKGGLVMKLKQLEYVAAIAEYGSILNASRHIYVSQPSISTAVQELESELGFEIFMRTSKGIIPTERGAQVISAAREILLRVDELKSLGTSDPSGEYVITLGANNRTSIRDLTGVAYEYGLQSGRQISFACDFRISVRSLIDGLNKGEIDYLLLCIFDIQLEGFRDMVRAQGLEMNILYEDTLSFLVCADHPMAGRTVTKEEFETYPILLHCTQAEVGRHGAYQTLRLNHCNPEPIFNSDSAEFENVLRTRHRDAVISIVTHHINERRSEIGDLALCRIQDITPLVHFIGVCRKSAYTKEIRAFERILKARFENSG